jgi:hypothetical protein
MIEVGKASYHWEERPVETADKLEAVLLAAKDFDPKTTSCD